MIDPRRRTVMRSPNGQGEVTVHPVQIAGMKARGWVEVGPEVEVKDPAESKAVKGEAAEPEAEKKPAPKIAAGAGSSAGKAK